MKSSLCNEAIPLGQHVVLLAMAYVIGVNVKLRKITIEDKYDEVY